MIGSTSPYKGSITREQFLFHEMRTTARLLSSGMSEQEAIAQIVSDNLYQYPTERMIGQMAHTCIRRLNGMEDPALVRAIAEQPSETAKQICLYAMMKQHRLIWDFMITVIGEKYRVLDMTFTRTDLNTFFMQLQEQDDGVASWSDETVKRIKSVVVKILVENGYLDNSKSTVLNPVLLDASLENAIRFHNDEVALPAFNCIV